VFGHTHVLGVHKQKLVASGKSKTAEAVRYAPTRREASSKTISGVATKLGAAFHDLVGALEHQDLADIARAGEGELAHLLVLREFRADKWESSESTNMKIPVDRPARSASNASDVPKAFFLGSDRCEEADDVAQRRR